MKGALSSALWTILGRRNFVRLSRFLLNEARLDVHNDLRHNGERALQRDVAAQLGTVFDVGANLGRWTRELRSMAPGAAVHAFEPCRGTCEALRANLAAWGLPDVVVNEVALSSVRGTAALHSFGDGVGRNGLHATYGSPATEVASVATETLDGYCEVRRIDRVDFIKIDAEGHDLAILRGGSRLFAGRRVLLAQFEYNARWIDARCYLRDAFDLLGGYQLGKVTPRGIEFYPRWDAELETFREANFVAVAPSLVPSLRRIPWWKQ